MDHFPELTYSMYVDRELPEPERLRVQEHLARCEACRRLVAALEAENRVLLEAFQAIEPEVVVVRGSIGRSLLLTVASALAVALGLDRVVTGVEHLAPAATSWLSPFSLSWFQSLFYSNALDLMREVPAVLNALVTMLGLIVLGAVVFSVLRHLLARHPLSMAVLATALFALGLPGPASAIEKRSGQVVRVGPNETVEDSLVTSGETVEIDGKVNGSVIAPARRVVVRGDIKGDLFVADQQTEISGTVEGNVFVWCQTLTVSGQVGRSIYFWGQSLQLDPSGRVDNDVWAGGDTLRLGGAVGRDVAWFGGAVDSSGTIGRNLQARTGLLTVASSARIGGNLEAHVHTKQEAQIDPGATIGGKTEVSLLKESPTHYADSKFYFWQAIWMASALILGLILNWLAPFLFDVRLDTGGALLRSAGIGFLVLVVTPIAAIIACITLVGIPAGVIGLVLWGVSIYLAKVFVGAALGRGLVRGRAGEPPAFALALLAGLIVVFVAINLPYVGTWLSFLVILVGLGLAIVGVRSSMTRRVTAP
ncbi:MAG TPA: zf-HC2 domain-containing protein [Terriglobia bacterium]